MYSNADSPTLYEEDGTLVFAKPWEEAQPFTEFLNYVIQQEKDPSSLEGEVRYAQTRMLSSSPLSYTSSMYLLVIS